MRSAIRSSASSHETRVNPGSPARRTIGWASRPRSRSSRLRSRCNGATSASTAWSSAPIVLMRSRLSRVVQRWTPGERPVVEAGDAERAAVAHALAQDAPRVRQVVAVLPDGLDHLVVVVRLLLADPVRLEADPEVALRALGRLDLGRGLPGHGGALLSARGRGVRGACRRWRARRAGSRRGSARSAARRRPRGSTAPTPRDSTGMPAIAAFCTISKLTRPETISTSSASGSAPFEQRVADELVDRVVTTDVFAQRDELAVGGEARRRRGARRWRRTPSARRAARRAATRARSGRRPGPAPTGSQCCATSSSVVLPQSPQLAFATNARW